MSAPDKATDPGAVQRERDAWVQAIDKVCSDWKRKSKGEHVAAETRTLHDDSIAEEAETADTDLESNGGLVGGSSSHAYPPVDYEPADPADGGGDPSSAGDRGQSYPSADKPVPKPRSSTETAVKVTEPSNLPAVPSPNSAGFDSFPPTSPQPSPVQTAFTSSSLVPESLTQESCLSAAKGPSLVPPPPPLPIKAQTSSSKPRTKAFHWDVVGKEKVMLSIKVRRC